MASSPETPDLIEAAELVAIGQEAARPDDWALLARHAAGNETLESIGRELGVSRERIRQRVARACQEALEGITSFQE
jgi:hypothetical protein